MTEAVSVVKATQATAVTYSDGRKAYQLIDANGDGDVTDFEDTLLLQHQDSALVIAGAANAKESLQSDGDPHLRNRVMTQAQLDEKLRAAQALFDDLKDGRLDDAGLVQRFDAAMTAGTTEYTGDFQADAVFLLQNGAIVEHDVAAVGQEAYTDNIDIKVKDLQLTVRDIWSGNGGVNEMRVSDTSSSAGEAVSMASSFDSHKTGGNVLPVFLELEGNNVQHGVMVFGAQTGKFGKFLDVNGRIDETYGRMSKESVSRFDDFVRGGFGALVSFDDSDDEQTLAAAVLPADEDEDGAGVAAAGQRQIA